MNNPFSTPPTSKIEPELAPLVLSDERPPWPKTKWLKVPLWAWIAAGVLGVGAVAAATPQPESAAVSVSTESPTVPASIVESTVPPTVATPVASTAAPTTAPPTVAPTTVPPTTVPTTVPPTTVPPPPPPTPAPTVPPTPAPTVPPTVAPAIPPPAPAAAVHSGGCDPNYTGCVPIDSDVDCAGGSGNGPSYANGPVQVIGSDIYGLDRDNDGIGCD